MNRVLWQSVPNCYEKYGLRGLPNPAIGDQPFHIIWFSERRPEMVPYPGTASTDPSSMRQT